MDHTDTNLENDTVSSVESLMQQKRISGLIHEPKLTWDQVDEIRRCYKFRSATQGTTALAKVYGVSANNICKIVRGKTWKVGANSKHVQPPLKHRMTANAFRNEYSKRNELSQKVRALQEQIGVKPEVQQNQLYRVAAALVTEMSC